MVHHSSLVQPTEAFSQASSPSPLYNKVVYDKHEDLMARFGAALGRGFIDAGGHDVTISLQSRVESRDTSTIIILVLVSIGALCLFGFRTNGYHSSEC